VTLARFLREVFYEKIEEIVHEEETGTYSTLSSLNSKIEYMFCWWTTHKDCCTLDQTVDDVNDVVLFWKKELEREFYLDILCEFLNLIRSDTLFPEALKVFIGFQAKTFRVGKKF